MTTSEAGRPIDREAFETLLAELRPKLHRYCARMTGSVIDGEDVVQDALAKALAAFPRSGRISNHEAWLFRIAHNAALDFLRRKSRQESMSSDVDPESLSESIGLAERREIAATGLRTFMRLPLVQRSAVLLMDVFGYSLRDVGAVMDASIPAVKSALNRGRTRLRELANEPEDVPVPVLGEPERSLLNAYVERFNARDFDAIRAMIADEVQLELVNRTRLNGRVEAGTYFGNYTATPGWHLFPGTVDGRPAALVRDDREPGSAVSYFILLEWDGSKVVRIRDFVHARYAANGAECFAACRDRLERVPTG
jgi:RNA polymerase sigma-70 factor (ECF subfamily)